MARARMAVGSRRVQLVAAFAAVYVIWGSTYLSIKFAIETMPPLLMAGVRFFIAGALLYTWVRLRGGVKARWVDWRTGLIVGGLLLVGGNGVVVVAEQTVPSSLAALLVAMAPVWMALLDWARPGGTRPSLPVALGLAVGFGGVALLVAGGSSPSGGSVHLIGLVAVVGAALSWAAGSLYSQHAPVPESPQVGTALEMLAGGAILLVLAVATGEAGQLHLATISLKSALALGYLIVFGSLVAFSAYVWLLRNTTLARVSTYAYVNPVVAVFLGWAFAGEKLTPLTFAAAAVIVGAVVIITTFRTRSQAPAADSKRTEHQRASHLSASPPGEPQHAGR
jgi:drug/metabolite transporter (DMT)-like permease